MIILLICSAKIMESHTLEFLQQGVWASLTGGWFYDLRQNVFCNTFHLYLWLFLLCFPFILHLYFVPSVILYSIYCGTIGLLFTLLKLINHRLHKMFDTTQCIQEVISGEDLPESQKIRSQTLGTKRILEDEGIELQVLNEQKIIDSQCDGCCSEPVNNDSTVSLEVKAKVISSTIDLKVDVHRKNSSESSDNLSLNLVSDCDMTVLNEREKINILKEPEDTHEVPLCTLKCKHSKVLSNNFRFKPEENIAGYNSDEFVLSQSDCFIAKHRKKSMEELSVECKMSQSDCQISSLRENDFEKNEMKKNVIVSSNSIQGHLYTNGMQKKNCSKFYYNNLKCDSQSDQNNKTFNMCNLISNGSCGVLPLNQGENKENMLINTGSLQLPLKDTENMWCNNEKGLLYWKQQNLVKAVKKNLNEPQIIYSNKKLKFSSPEIHIFNENSLDTSNFSEDADKNRLLQNSSANEKSFLKILEESFDWWGGDYQCKNSNLQSTKENSNLAGKIRENEEIKEKHSIKNSPKCGLKFQIDSDEDLSDNNRGSQSPLLCRNENVKKDAQFLNEFTSLEIVPFQGPGQRNKKVLRSFSGNGRWCSPHPKINRTLSFDENVISIEQRNSEKDLENYLNDTKKNSFSSFLLTVYDDANDTIGTSGENKQYIALSSDNNSRCPSAPTKNEMKVSSNSLHNELKSSESEFKKEDFTEQNSCEVDDGSEKITGLDWLFQCQDISADNLRNDISGKNEDTQTEFLNGKPKDSETLKSNNNRGAIPKVKVQKKSVVDSSKNGLSRQSKNLSQNQKLNIERENSVLEEQFDTIDERKIIREECEVSEVKNLPWRETSGSSSTELSSILPLSSLLSSLHPPTSPLLAAFLATRKEISESAIDQNSTLKKNIETKENRSHQSTLIRSTHKRNKKSGKVQSNRNSRSARVSSIPLVALASVVSSNSGIHLAASHDDTSQGAVHYFQDEKGNWMSYTFDHENSNLNRSPTPLDKAFDALLAVENLRRTENRGCSNAYCFKDYKLVAHVPQENQMKVVGLQQSARTVHIPLSFKKDRDLNFVNVVKIRGSEISSIPNQNHCFRRRNNDRDVDRNVKCVDACDSSINLVSNSNSENESFFSLNSTNVSPSVDLTTSRSTLASIVRDRFIVNQGNSMLQQSLSSSANGSCSNYNFASLTSNEVPHDDSRISAIYDGKNSNNNNNSAVNNNNVSGQNNNTFQLERLSNVPSRRTPFGLISETFFERNRQRNGPLHASTVIHEVQIPPNIIQGSDQEHGRGHLGVLDMYDLEGETERKCKPRHYYKLHYTPWSYVKIRFDRLELTALLDRNLTVAEIVLSLFLSTMVSACGIVLLNYGFYRDLFAFLFCFALAGCQYSLLKSVQPDATSPTHGYNRIVVYSRSIYFCVTSLLILFLTKCLDEKSDFSFYFYGIRFTNNNLIRTLRDNLINLLLFFPILFTLGLFPQINTFCLYLLEQIDIHIFGGNAMSSLLGAAFCISRSCVAIIFVYGFAYGALIEVKTTQHILFSIFCGLLISLSYHLSRSSSNPNVLWDILKDQLFQDEIREKSSHNSLKNEEKKSINKTSKGETGDKNNDCEKFCSLSEASNQGTSSKLSTADENRAKEEILSDAFEIPENSNNCNDGNITIDDENKVCGKEESEQDNFVDPLPEKLQSTVNARLKNDAIVCTVVAVFVFVVHCSTVFTTLQPDLNPILWGIAGCSGFVLHYVVPELRKHLPWLCLAGPILKCQEHAQFEVKNAAKIMWFEETYLILCFLERNLLYPVLILASVTYDGPRICEKFGVSFGALITSVCGMKIMRSAFSNISQQYLIVIFSALLFEFDYHSCSETFLVDYFFIGIVFSKVYEFLLKIQFVVIYIAPWQITWGSAFHAFAQPFSVPHSAMLFVQAAVSAVLSAPLNPFLGSAIFLASYVRPIKFWERDYNTKRVDHSNTRMSSHLERNLGSDDNNLNSIFYEHLTRSLQHSLCGDLELGRWGPVYQGDCFVLASDYLNCLVHIIEMGNGLVTFQVRGLEFRGTYCQQREVEAISERVEDDDGCCCCELCHVPHVLSVNAAFSKRWLAWEVTASKYVLEGYSISDNSAASTLEVFDFRKVLVTYYVKSIIFYCVRSPKLQSWLTNPAILSALEPLKDRTFVDLDPVFNINIDQDFDTRAEGITRNSFCAIFLGWIQYCCSKFNQAIDRSLDSTMVSLCFALSLIGRRTLGTASHNTVSSVEFFLYGLHALFKGDFRITSVRDDWIFADMEFLTKVIAPGIRMSLKLHQDHFMSPDEYEDPSALFDAISTHEKNLVISHEGDPAWRRAVLSGKPSLLALRRVLDDGSDEYKIIMLNKRFLSFRVIKLNRECVRGLWAGQQQELVFLRNRNPERGSIQNAKQVLRNMINSSCDQPIGYPIYVSPLTTSYSDTNKQFTSILGGPLSLQGLKNTVLKMWRRVGQRCREGCSSGGGIVNGDEGPYSLGQEAIYALTTTNTHSVYGQNSLGNQFMDSSQSQLSSSNRGGSLGRSSLGGRGSSPSVNKPSTTLASLAGLLSSSELPKGESMLKERETSFSLVKERQSRDEKEIYKRYSEKKEEKERKRDEKDLKKDKEKSIGHSVPEQIKDSEDVKDKDTIYQRVRIIHPNLVFDAINLGRRIDVLWPDEGMRLKGGRSYWKDWLPDFGMEGQVVHRWVPNHRDPAKRSNVDKTILLVKIDDKFVPIAEAGVQDLGVEV